MSEEITRRLELDWRTIKRIESVFKCESGDIHEILSAARVGREEFVEWFAENNEDSREVVSIMLDRYKFNPKTTWHLRRLYSLPYGIRAVTLKIAYNQMMNSD